VKRVASSLFGQMVRVEACPTCRGEGSVITNPCPTCGGSGTEEAKSTVSVRIPPGVATGNYLTLRGQGHAGPRGGPPGDLIVTLEVEDDERFERHGDDLVFDLPVSFSQAALGAELSVPTPYGDERVKVVPGTQAGTVLRLRGKGLPHLGSAGKGDLHVRIAVWTPERMSPEMEALFRQLGAIEGAPPDAREARSFWDRMRGALGG